MSFFMTSESSIVFAVHVIFLPHTGFMSAPMLPPVLLMSGSLLNQMGIMQIKHFSEQRLVAQLEIVELEPHKQTRKKAKTASSLQQKNQSGPEHLQPY